MEAHRKIENDNCSDIDLYDNEEGEDHEYDIVQQDREPHAVSAIKFSLILPPSLSIYPFRL